jgi:hypothetical protein
MIQTEHKDTKERDIPLRMQSALITTFQSQHYESLRKELRLGFKEIARRCSISDTTVRAVLLSEPLNSFFSPSTAQKVFDTIDTEAAHLREALNRLSNHATH